MKYAWIDTQRSAFPLPVLCDALSVSQSGFRAWQEAFVEWLRRAPSASAGDVRS